MRPSLLTGSVVGGVGLKSEVVNGTLGRTSFDDNCSMSEGLKRTALSSSLRDLSDTGETATPQRHVHYLLSFICPLAFFNCSIVIIISFFFLLFCHLSLFANFPFPAGLQANVVAGTVLVLWTVPWK